MPSNRNRLFMVAALLMAFLACVGIVVHFTLSAPPVIPDLASLGTLPTIVPGAPKATGPLSQIPPSGPPQPQATPSLPPAPKIESQAELDKQLRESIRFRLKPEEFVFDSLPHDAPLAEFPLVLVDQRLREWYLTHDVMSPNGVEPSERHGPPPKPPPRPPPGPPPGPPPEPPEESTSGL